MEYTSDKPLTLFEYSPELAAKNAIEHYTKAISVRQENFNKLQRMMIEDRDQISQMTTKCAQWQRALEILKNNREAIESNE